MDDKRALEQEALMKILKKHFKELTGFDGVTSAGVGLRVKNGQYTDELCIYVEVIEKLPPSAVKDGQLIPAAVEGIHVDVVQKQDTVLESLTVKIEDLENEDKIRPLQGGSQITNGIEEGGTVSVGTLGAMIYVPDKKNSYIGIMSNHHVMYARGATDGHAIGQPSGSDTIGTIVGGLKDSEVDFAVAKMATVSGTNTVRLIGNLAGFGGAVIGMRVRKCGRTTDLTTGQITKVGVWCDDNVCVFTGLEVMQGWPTRDPSVRFSAPGDSGSVVVDDANNVVGLHFAGTQTAPFVSNSNDIRRVRQRVGQFQIPIPSDSQMTQVLSDTSRLSRYRASLEKSERGRTILTAFVENLDEGIQLVNSQRECMVAWQRNKGPGFISLRKGLDENEPYVLRKEIEGITMEEMMTKMRYVFSKHGSPRMAEVLRLYGDEVIKLAIEHDTMDDIVQTLSTQP